MNRLINKQDIEGALEDVHMMNELDIETLANKYESITKIVSWLCIIIHKVLLPLDVPRIV